MFKKNSMKQKGFTLIELMIVVAIIGILAAIAIPQFSAYRMKAFNAAAESDMRNLMTAEEAHMADLQYYYPGAGNTNVVTQGPGSGSPNSLATYDGGLPGAKLSTNVQVAINSDASGINYSIYSGHNEGDHVYGGNNLGTMSYEVLSAQTITSSYNAGLTASGLTALNVPSTSPWAPM